MNLIEKLGGYEKAKEALEWATSVNWHDISGEDLETLRAQLLTYRREHNIFEEGDTIECIDANNQRYLKPGQIYEVRKMDGHKLYVVGYQRFSFLSSRFKHAEPKQ